MGDLGFGIEGLRCEFVGVLVYGVGVRVYISGFRVSGLGCGV